MSDNSTFGAVTPGGNDIARKVDEILRRTLGISDARNVEQVASGLRKRYALEAARSDQESLGFAIGSDAANVALTMPTRSAEDTPGDRELKRVTDALQQDLQVLIDAPANREWKPELAGWRSVMLRALAEGAAAARFAQDPARRDEAFLAVRTLNEYSRIARLVGVMYLEMNYSYRRLAKTLDEGAHALRILAGEALYRAGLSDGGFILSVPLVDLRARGAAVVGALRGLLGLEPTDSSDTGEGLYGYGLLLQALEVQGLSELKSYLREETLQRTVDEMLDALASGVSQEDGEQLRALASTMPVAVMSLQRMARVASDLMPGTDDPGANTLTEMGLSPSDSVESATFSRFVQALNLFCSGIVQQRTGARLIDIAVPLPLAAAQSEEGDGDARRVLRDLIECRASYAREIDTYLTMPDRQRDDLRTQVRFDMVLHYIDRAIDLYALGQPGIDGDSWGTDARRAAVVGVLADNLLRQNETDTGDGTSPFRRAARDAQFPSSSSAMPWRFDGENFTYPVPTPVPGRPGEVTAPPPPALGRSLFPDRLDGWTRDPLVDLLGSVRSVLFSCDAYLQDWVKWGDGTMTIPPAIPASLTNQIWLEQERMNTNEQRWRTLVDSMVPRSDRVVRWGRPLSLAGLDLLTFNPNFGAFPHRHRSFARARRTGDAALNEVAVSLREIQTRGINVRAESVPGSSHGSANSQQRAIALAWALLSEVEGLLLRFPLESDNHSYGQNMVEWKGSASSLLSVPVGAGQSSAVSSRQSVTLAAVKEQFEAAFPESHQQLVGFENCINTALDIYEGTPSYNARLVATMQASAIVRNLALGANRNPQGSTR